MSGRKVRRTVVVLELLGTDSAAEKLGARGISVDEAQQLIDNRYEILPNRGRARHGRRRVQVRRLLIGHTDGGRALTLVVERTHDPTTWLIVTGWSATDEQRRMIED